MAMAYKKRLVRERQKFLEAPPDGMTLLPSQVPDALVWQVAIQGPEGSLYDGEVYTLQLTFSEKYPFDSPEVVFVGESPAHPHIYSNGHICLNILSTGWSPALTGQAICVSIQSMLSTSPSKVRGAR
eukprot:m.183380 g.183380  ORF g.183380 m.183380 type:complete len:127 (+) comp14690_c1_seq6:1406-1786(+)